VNERCLVIIPTYNEAANLEALVKEILLVGDLLGEPPVNVLVIDDNSPDGTGTVAEQLRAQHGGRVDVLHRLQKLGLGTAYVVGFHYALASNYDYVVQMDADFSHDPSLLPRLLRAARQADLVIGSRYVAGGGVRHWPLWRQLLSQAGSAYGRLVLGLDIRDLTSGYKCFRREALEALDLGSLKSNGYSFQIEVTYRCFERGMRIVEVPITFADRVHGRSKMALGIVWEALLTVGRLRLTSIGAARRRPVLTLAHTRGEPTHIPSPRDENAA
jgi:dolichol-phosphate mannosyltransferase